MHKYNKKKYIATILVFSLLFSLLMTDAFAVDDTEMHINVPTTTGWRENKSTGELEPYGNDIVVDLYDRLQLDGAWIWSMTEGTETGAVLDAETGTMSISTFCSAGSIIVVASRGEEQRSLRITLEKPAPYPKGALIHSPQNSILAPAEGGIPVQLQYSATVYDQYGGIVPIEDYSASWYILRQDDWSTEYTILNGVSIDETGLLTVLPGTQEQELTVRFKWGTSSSSQNSLVINTAPEEPEVPAGSLHAVPGSAVSGNCEYTKTDTGYSAAVELKNTSGVTKTVHVLLAEYDKEGRMLNVGVKSLEIAANGTASAALNTEDKTADTLSLFVTDDRGAPLTQNCKAKTAGIGAEAWYEVENGTLYLRTNIDSRDWTDGYSGTIRMHFADGGYSHDNGGNRGKQVYYSILTLPHNNAGTKVTQIDYLVFDTSSFAYSSFWPLYRELDDFNAAVEACLDHLVARFTLDTPLTVADSDETLTLDAFDISYDETGANETYTAVLREPLSDEGEYSLHYRPESGNSHAGMTYIGRDGDKLTFTRGSHHFADAGAVGSFTIRHAVHKVLDDGSIVCYKAESNPYPYTFER